MVTSYDVNLMTFFSFFEKYRELKPASVVSLVEKYLDFDVAPDT